MKQLSIKPKQKQEVALNLLRKHWKTDRTMLLYAPTGSGKTAIAAFITNGVVQRGMRVMFAAPYTTLLNQTAERFVQYGINEEDIAFVWADHPNQDTEKMIQIASADTVIRRGVPENIDLLIIDECHIKRQKIVDFIKQTKIKVIGLSGTPFAGWLGNYYERLIKPTTMRELIDLGDLSDYEFYAPVNPSMKGVKTVYKDMGADFDENQIAEIMCGADLVGNIVQNWLSNGEDRQTICFCVNIKHANFVTLEFRKQGVQAEIVTGKTPQHEREAMFSRFDNGFTRILINVGVLVAGFDSDVRCIIYARPTKSEIRWVQCLGRGLRTAKGKDKCLIFDHSGSVHRLGFPDQIEYDELPKLEDKENGKRKEKEEEKKDKLPKECPLCHAMKPAGVYECPKCGFKPLTGEDVEVDESRGLQKVKGEKKVYSQKEKQEFYYMLKGYQAQKRIEGKNYKDGWVANQYRAKFGVWPKGMGNHVIEPSPQVINFIKHNQIKFAKSRKKDNPESREELEAKKVANMSKALAHFETLREKLHANG